MKTHKKVYIFSKFSTVDSLY